MKVEEEAEVECFGCGEAIEGEAISVCGDDYCSGCAVECADCGDGVHRDDAHTYSGEEYCDDCVVVCEGWSCRVVMRPDDAVDTDTGTFCSSCTEECGECGGAHHSDNLYYVQGGGNCCSDCCMYCDSCGCYYRSGDMQYNETRGSYYCEDCNPGERLGVRPYGHTRAHSYLRTKEEHQTLEPSERWYIGIEHEITAPENCDAEPVYRWAEKHLGSTEYIECKEDSSVEGFEIVTQPMTPAFFEQVDWDSYMRMLNRNYPLYGGEEPDDHGIHVHIGRKGLDHDDINIASYAYLLSQGKHLDRIARREPHEYCQKVIKPVSTAIVAKMQRTGDSNRQADRIRYGGIYPGRNAINLTNPTTVEIRAFRSTRQAQDLKDAVRVTYLGAEYIRSLRNNKSHPNGKTLHWSQFAMWVGQHHPEAFRSIAGL